MNILPKISKNLMSKKNSKEKIVNVKNGENNKNKNLMINIDFNDNKNNYTVEASHGGDYL